MAVIAATLAATFVVTTLLGRLLGVEAKLTQLIAAGTSICGASAVIATNSVTEGSDEDVAYAVACVTVFGSLSMFLYPVLPALLHLDPHRYGLWAGASIHEIAQVVAATFQNGREAGDFGTIAKLSRVALLAPMVILLGLVAARRRPQGARPAGGIPVPWFVLGFLALIGVNSVGLVSGRGEAAARAGDGLHADRGAGRDGARDGYPQAPGERVAAAGAGALSWLFIAGFSLMLIELFA